MSRYASSRRLALLFVAGLSLTWGVVSGSPAVAEEPGGGGGHHLDLKTGPRGVAGNLIVYSDGGRLRKAGGSNPCPGCTWSMEPQCDSSSRAAAVPNPLCADPATAGQCPLAGGKKGQVYRIYLTRTDVDPRFAHERHVSDTCLGAPPVVLDGKVRSYADQMTPATAPLLVQPVGYGLVRLPTLMRTEQPPPGPKNFFGSVGGLGFTVTVAVSPNTWHWMVNGAEVRVTDFPGRAYEPGRSPRQDPDYYASHTFTETGTYQLAVRVDWTATVTISGLGATPIDGVITRTSPALALTVKQARSQLEHS